MKTWNVRIATCVGVTALGLFDAGVWGQTRLGDGHGLDRNLRAGSNGANESQPYDTGQYQNALVNGNIGGLGRFHGGLSSRDFGSGEFSGNLSSNNSFNFLRNSAAPASNPNVAPSQPLLPSGYGAPQALYRSGSGVTSGQINGQYVPGVPGFRSDSIESNGLSAPARQTLGVGGAIPLDSGQLSGNLQSLAVTSDTSGRLLQITASPLTGVRTSQIGQEPLLLPPAGTNPDSPGRVNPIAPPIVPQPVSPSDSNPANPPATNGVIDARINADLPPAVLLSQRLNPMGNGPRSGAFRADVLDEQMFHPQAWASTAPGEDPYADLLTRINAQKGAVTLTPAAERPADHLAGAVAGSKEQPKTSAEKLADEIRAKAAPPEKADPDAEKFVSKLDYKFAPLNSMAGVGTGAFQSSMQRAEAAMADGKFFTAEDHYSEAESISARHPLALIGRVNAEIGAGLYASAASNLRTIFTFNPQLIALRYGPKLLPGDQRLVRIDEDLQSLLTRDTTTNPPLLIAYLAYQRDDKAHITEALRVMGSRDPDDPLLPLLNRIWARPFDSDK
jgi:hypothetical protein